MFLIGFDKQGDRFGVGRLRIGKLIIWLGEKAAQDLLPVVIFLLDMDSLGWVLSHQALVGCSCWAHRLSLHRSYSAWVITLNTCTTPIL